MEAVQDFYERHPYPRPIESLAKYQQLWHEPQRRRADFHLHWPARPYRDDFSILIAGCGTSQAARHAVRWPEASVVGIDFSATSVRHTQELGQKHQLRNLEVRQLSIERAGELGKTFDQIVCTGVLHHLADPDAGLKALRTLLKPDGVMHVMVYAPYGRTGIYMLQEFCRRLGIEPTEPGIRDLSAALNLLPSGHPLAPLLREAPDFRHEAALADALLNPQDRAYSVGQLLTFIKDGGLKLVRFVKQAPYSAHCGLMSRLPQRARLLELGLEEQFAAAELFRGTMVRHSVIVRRDDSPPAAIDFEDEAWLRYVPIRLPDTICVGEKVPPGATAVLINRTHSYTDLYLPIDAQQKRLFDAIDGKRSVGQIAGESGAEATRALFERLWWMDQIVFDVSA
jgi:SAM-dependent methyltransferase